MEINDEMIACYIEGKCSSDELFAVRQYLCQHPEKCEMIVALLGNDDPVTSGVSANFNSAIKRYTSQPRADYGQLRASASCALGDELSRVNSFASAPKFDCASPSESDCAPSDEFHCESPFESDCAPMPKSAREPLTLFDRAVSMFESVKHRLNLDDDFF